MERAIDWQRYDALKAQGLKGRALARALGIPESTLRGGEKRRDAPSMHGAVPVQRTVHHRNTVDGTDTVHSAVHDQIMARLDALEIQLQDLRNIMHQSSAESMHDTGAEPIAP